MRIESFLPSRHGFTFASVAPPPGEQFGLATPIDAAFGLSAGMVWVALDRYLAGRPLEPAADPRLHAELVQRQTEALAVRGWPELRAWQALPERGWPWRPGLRDASRAQWRQVRHSLDAGMPVMLYLLLASGRHADPSAHQAVLAYGYEVDRRTRRISIRVYDPSRPGNDGVRLVFRMGERRSQLDARLAVQTAVRGFVSVPYDRPRPASLSLTRTETGSVEGVASLLAVKGGRRSEGAIEVLARSHAGGVLQVRRRRAGQYVAQKVDAKVLDSVRVDQASLLAASRMVVRTSDGELLECARRTGLGWRGRSISGSTRKSAVDAGVAVVADRAGMSLFACGSGRLLHFQRGKLARWSVEHITAGSLLRATCAGTPGAARFGRSLHAVARTETGELMHARWRGKASWTAENVTARAGQRERFLIADDPLLLPDTGGRQLNVVGRSTAGAVLLFRWTQRAGWRAQDLSGSGRTRTGDAHAVDSPLSATLDADGTVHVIGRTSAGGVLHAWCTRAGAAGVQELCSTRPAIGDAGRIEGTPSVLSAPAGALHVVARRGTDLLLYRWANGADWSCENLSVERAGPALAHEPLAIVMDRTAHVAALDHAGRIHNISLAGVDAHGDVLVPSWLLDIAALPLAAVRLVIDSILAVLGAVAGGAGMLARGFGSRAARASAVMGSGAEAMARSVGRGAVSGFRMAEGAPAGGGVALDPGIAHMDALTARPRAVPPDVTMPDSQVADAADAWETDAGGDAAPVEQDLWNTANDADAASAEPWTADGSDSWSTEGTPLQVEEDSLLSLESVSFGAPEPVSPETESAEETPMHTDEVALEAAPAPEATGHDAPVAEAPAPRRDAELILVYPEPETPTGGNVVDDVVEDIVDDVMAGVVEDVVDDIMAGVVEDFAANVVEDAAAAVGKDASHDAMADLLPIERPDTSGATNAPAAEALGLVDFLPADAHSNGETPAVARQTPVDDWNEPAGETEPLPTLDPAPVLDVPGDAHELPVEANAAADTETGGPDAAPARSIAATDDDWNLPPSADAEPTTLPADDRGHTPAEPAPSSAASDDDWNLPATAPRRNTPEGTDWSLPPLEDESAASESEMRPRKWQNPALEGLPLLDDDEPVERAAAAKPKLPPKPKQAPSKQAARRRKKNTAADEMERMIALAEANKPELLAPE